MAPASYKRLHTFSRMPNRSQIILYLIIIMTNLCFYLCVMELLHQEVERQIILSIFTIFSGLMIFGGIVTGQIDPTDQVTTKYLEDKKNFNQFLLQNQKRFNITDLRQCILCDAKCKKCSLHCKDCKRCIQGRDHHCDYLNICIGCRNYKIFFITVCLTWGFLSMYIFSMAFVTYKLKNIGEQLYMSAQFIVGWIAVFFVLITWVLITALLVFHCYLIKNNITTIQFIKKDINIGRKPKKVQRKQTKVQEQTPKKVNQQQQIYNDPLKLFIKNLQEQPTNSIIIKENQTTSKSNDVNAPKQNQDTIKFNTNSQNQQKINTNLKDNFSNKVSQKNSYSQSSQIRNINKIPKIQEIDSVKIQIRQYVQDEIKKQDQYEYQVSVKDDQMTKTTQKIFKSRPFKYMIGTDVLEQKILSEQKQKVNKRTENISRSGSQTQSSKSNLSSKK